MLRIRLLGEQTIADDTSRVLPTRSARALAVAGFLVLHAGRPQSRQHIAGLFWPDSADAQALTNLRRELHNLRSALGDTGALVVTTTDLCWCGSETVDADLDTFRTERDAALACHQCADRAGLLQHGSAAVETYRGEFMPGLYEDWALDARALLRDQCVELCDLVRSARLDVGDLPGALEIARRRVALAPLEESGYRALMQVHAELGDGGAAVSTYHRCASVLERELGVQPDPATRAALAEVMRRLGVDRLGRHRPEAQPRELLSGGAPALVGRDTELATVGERWRSAAAGRAQVMVISGGAGVGKSRLLAELTQGAQRAGALVATTRCFSASARLTLAPIADWLRNRAIGTAVSNLDPRWRAEVERLTPTGAEATARPAGTPGLGDAWQRRSFFEGLARALVAANRPTLLVLDDLQWCDEETLSVLSLLLSITPDAPVLVAATMRDDADIPGEVRAWLGRLRGSTVFDTVQLGPLDRDGTAALASAVARRSLRDGTVDLLYATTGGFPLFVVEAVRSLAESGAEQLPETDVDDLLQTRLQQAGETAREVAGLAAAVGTSFDLDLLTEASDLRPEAVVDAVDELWQRRLLRELPDGYDFTHDLIRDAAYNQISPPRRWLLHRRIAQALELLHPDDSELFSAQLADQYRLGGRPERAITHYRRAAAVASSVFAHGEAIRLLETALTIVLTLPVGSARDRLELGVLEALAAPLNSRDGYSSTRLQQTQERAVHLAERVGDRDSVLNALASLWTSRFVQGRLAESYRLAQRMLDLAGTAAERNGVANFAVGGSALGVGRPALAVHHFELAAASAGGALSISVGTRPDVHSTAWVAHAHWLRGEEDRAVECSASAIALARTIAHPYSLAVALAYGAITDQMRRDVMAVRVKVAELDELCSRYGFAYYREWAVVLRGWSRQDGSGIGLARDGIDTLKAAGSFARMPYWLSLLAELFELDGREGPARAALDAALASGMARDDLWWLPEVLRNRARFDPPAARRARLTRAAAMARDHGSAALLARCERDLSQSRRRAPRNGVRVPADAKS